MNQNWPNENSTTLQIINSTLDDMQTTKEPEMTTLDWAAEKKAIYIIDVVLHCMFLIVGLFGNILTIVVLVFKKWTNITSRHILTALAVSDTTMLICQTFHQEFLKDFFKVDARALSSFGCKVFFTFYRTSKMTSSWFVVFLCFERFVAVKFPLKVKTIITNLRRKVYILVIYLTMASFAIVLSFSNATASKTCKKDPVPPSLRPVFLALVLTDMLIYSVLPIILMSVFTPIIILQLFKSYQARKSLSNISKARKEREMQQLKEMIRTTTILLSVVVAFIICVTPITVFEQVRIWSKIKMVEIETTYSIFVFREISQRFEQVNYSINFFLYIFTSPAFRKTVLKMLHINQNRERHSTLSDDRNK